MTGARETAVPHVLDPPVLRWDEFDLPDTWADHASSGPRGWWRLLRRVFGGKHNHIDLPDALPLCETLPRYLQQEFHNLPNGNYSNRLTQGYARGFDMVMLGTMRPVRRLMAETLSDCNAVLDLGCSGGESTQALVEAGIQDVWGLDASPYFLRIAQRAVPNARFLQGLAERTGFPDGRFDGVACCFLFHEIPPSYADQALAEIHRVLRPAGRLVIIEPSPEQYLRRWWRLLRQFGWRGVYFRLLASLIYEPFVPAWHRRNAPKWLTDGGFNVVEDRTVFPARVLLAERR